MNPLLAEYILSIDLQIEELNGDWNVLRDKQAGHILKKEIERLKQKKIELYNSNEIH